MVRYFMDNISNNTKNAIPSFTDVLINKELLVKLNLSKLRMNQELYEIPTIDGRVIVAKPI